MSASAEHLLRALRRLPPRAAHLLTLRFVEGQALPDAAGAYGVSPGALAVHTLRAARLFAVALSREGPGPILPADAAALPDAEESRRAARLEAALDGPGGAVAQAADEIDALAGPLRALSAEGAQVRRLAAEWEARQRESPGRRRADLLRRAALVALIALALWLYLRAGN